jgi:hypothetical protein
MTALATAAQTVTLSLTVENHYTDRTITGRIHGVAVPAPAGDLTDWAALHLFPHTGTGRTGNAWYEVEITASTDPALVGMRFELG